MIIYKYELTFGEHQTLDLPEGASILSIGNQHGRLVFWVMFDEANERATTKRKFRVQLTGHSFRPTRNDALRFLGTALFSNDSFVAHVFEEVETSAG